MAENRLTLREAFNKYIIPSATQNLEYLNNLKEGIKYIPSNIFNYDESNMGDDPGKKIAKYKRGVNYPEKFQFKSIFPKMSQQILSNLADDTTKVLICIKHGWRGHQMANIFVASFVVCKVLGSFEQLVTGLMVIHLETSIYTLSKKST